jgi:hypothetical protein
MFKYSQQIGVLQGLKLNHRITGVRAIDRQKTDEIVIFL